MNFLATHKQLFERLPKRFAQAADAAIAKILEYPEVLGFVLAGSVAQNSADEFSDLDFYIVTNGKERWRGCWVFERLALVVTPLEPIKYVSQKQIVVL